MLKQWHDFSNYQRDFLNIFRRITENISRRNLGIIYSGIQHFFYNKIL